MTISQNTTLPTTSNSISIDDFWIEYNREDFYGDVNNKLLEALTVSGLTKADLARRLDNDPAAVTRWLASPRNMTLRSIADLATALGLIPKLILEKIDNTSQPIGHVRTHDGTKEVTFHVTATFGATEGSESNGMSSISTTSRYDEEVIENSESDAWQKLYISATDNNRVMTGESNGKET